MSNRCILPLAFLLVLLFVSLAESCSAQGQPQDEKQKDTAYQGKTVSQWIEVLKDKDVRVRNAAATALGQIGPAAKAAVPALIEALKDKDRTVRRVAAFVLGQIGPAAVPALIEALKKDRVGRYSTAVVDALGKIGPVAVPALIEALKDKESYVRMYAAEALGQFAPAAKATVPALMESLKDNDRCFPGLGVSVPCFCC